MKLSPKIVLIAAALMTVSAAPAAFAESHEAALQMINPYKGVHSVQAAIQADFATLGIVNVRTEELTLQQLIAIEAVIVNEGDNATKKTEIERIIGEN